MTEASVDLTNNAALTLEIVADGTRLAPQLQIYSVEVSASTDATDQASVVLIGAWSDITAMPLGAEVTISAGHAIALDPLFSGVVMERSAAYPLDAAPTVAIGCAGTLAPGVSVALTCGESIINFTGTVKPVDGVDRCTGTVKSLGINAALGGTATLAGIGVPFDGTKTITSVRHDIRDGNWTTEIGFDESAPISD